MNTINIKDKEIEIRSVEITATDESRTVSGYAVRFDESSVNIGFIETIKKGAITDQTIKESDVFALLNHQDNVVLARCKNGEGSMKLTVDDAGLFYEFEAPHTSAGDELLEHIKRGEISQSSFAFVVDPSDETAQRYYIGADGQKHRDIYKIAYLFDCSPVYQPAYETTTCNKRSLDELQINTEETETDETPEQKEVEILKETVDELEKENTELKEEIETVTEKVEEQTEQTETVEETETVETENENTESTEENSDENTQINTVDDNNKSDETADDNKDEETADDADDKETKTENNKRNYNIIMENFSLVKELRNAIANGTKIDFRSYDVTAEGADMVQTDVYDIWAPLRAKNVLADAGARIITGIKNNVQIPVFGATTAYFADELGAATDGTGAVTSKKLSPKRVCAKVPVSLELLAQDNIGFESMLRADIANAVLAAVEDKVFGAQAESTDVYAGMFNGQNPGAVATFADLTALEASVEGVGVDCAKCVYVMSPAAKGKLRAMPKSAKTTELVMQAGEIDGTTVYSTGHQTGTNIVYGDFSNLVIATWDNVQIDVVRDTASLTNGVVTLVVNAYVDAKIARPNAFAYATV